MLKFRYHVEFNSDLDLNAVRERILDILQKRKYSIVKKVYDMLVFDNRKYRRSYGYEELKVEQGVFYLLEENDLVVIKFKYSISYLSLIVGIVMPSFLGFLVDQHFFLLGGFALLFWPIYFLILRAEAQELIDALKKQL